MLKISNIRIGTKLMVMSGLGVLLLAAEYVLDAELIEEIQGFVRRREIPPALYVRSR